MSPRDAILLESGTVLLFYGADEEAPDKLRSTDPYTFDWIEDEEEDPPEISRAEG